MKRRFWLGGFLALIGALASVPAQAETESFTQALIEVYRTNPTLLAERAKLRATDEQVSQALSNWRPDIEATADVGLSNQTVGDPPSAPIPSSSNGLTPRSTGIQITQPLFRGFRTVAQTHAAEKQVAAERARLEATEQKVFLDAGTAYLDVVHDEALVALDRDNERVLENELDVTRQRLKVGDAGLTDVHEAESRLERATADRLKAEDDLDRHSADYVHLVGDTPGTDLPPVHLKLPSPLSLDETIDLAKDDNPGIKAASADYDETDEEITLNEGSLLPEIDLVGGVQRQWDQSTYIPGRQDSAQIMVRLTMPLYKSGTDYSRTREAEQKATERRMELEEARHQAYADATDGWHDLQISRDVLAADQEEEEASQEALENVREQAKAGTRTELDVLNAEQELIDAKSGVIQAEHDINVAILHIRSATGRLTAKAMKLSVDLYDPDTHYQAARGQWIGFSDDDDDGTTAEDGQDH